ncbi:hypothetical protein [Nocardioides sp. Root140]|uniref:hypothetical protein n=1 Tax=Nocardioides sp. Root140 TaxID=1736460 RepID=UPI0006F7F0BB|nr:hypothetical protein [Nocardioides sp. Root140]KQY61835.1 hypothetical protein ASD30_25165 [Nocardioides sp. Root140]
MASHAATLTLPEGVYSDGEHLWRAKAGVSSTFEEHEAARDLFMDLHRDQFWNPWRMEEQAGDLERAQEVMEEWERAEPGFRQMTKRQMQARLARMDREAEKRLAAKDVEREANLQCYDSDRDQARLRLLEARCVLAHKESELDGLKSGERFPAMAPERRAADIAKLEAAIEALRATVGRLVPVVGDPEDVPDEHGRLPRDRRSLDALPLQQAAD